MKQIVLILLFIFTLQNKINFKYIIKDQYLPKKSSFRISSNQECPSGYYKHCFVKGMYIGTSKLPYQCYCYERKIQKINRILKEVKTTKNRTTTNGDRLIKDKYFLPSRRRLFSVEKNSSKCNGEYYVCYVIEYTNRSKLDCHCSKFAH